jgi:hypothetical protein
MASVSEEEDDEKQSAPHYGDSHQRCDCRHGDRNCDQQQHGVVLHRAHDPIRGCAPFAEPVAGKVGDRRVELRVRACLQRSVHSLLELVPSQAAFNGRLTQPVNDRVAIGVRCSENSAPRHLGIRLARACARCNRRRRTVRGRPRYGATRRNVSVTGSGCANARRIAASSS